MNRLTAFFLLGMMVCNFAHAAEDDENQDIPWAKLKSAAERYLETCVSKKDRKAMSKEMDARVDQRVNDMGVSAEQAAREIMFDWAADNSDNLSQKEPKAVAQVCFYFVMFVKKGFMISKQIRERLTPAICDEILSYLDGEVKNNSMHASARSSRPVDHTRPQLR